MSIGIFGFLGQNASETTIRVETKQDALEKKFDAFTDKWDKRIKTTNNINNETQKKIVEGVDYIVGIITQEFGNLTQHRVVTNATFDNMGYLIKQLNDTNEAGRDKAVDRIIEKIDKLAEGLNVNITEPIIKPQLNQTELNKLIQRFLANNTS